MLLQIHVIRSEGNLTMKMKLHSLRIKDKLQGCFASHSQYLAFSVVANDHILSSPKSVDLQSNRSLSLITEEEDIFRDALPEFTPTPHSLENSDADADSLLSNHDVGKGKGSSSEIFYEALGSDNSEFVSVTFMSKDPSSPEYEGIDTQVIVSVILCLVGEKSNSSKIHKLYKNNSYEVSNPVYRIFFQMDICMSKLEFFCNRPTIVSLIQFGLDMSSVNLKGSSVVATMSSEDLQTKRRPKNHDDGDVFVKGLLGYGKGRVVFKLSMNVDSVTVFLNQEDGTQFAMFIQESFVLDLRVCFVSLFFFFFFFEFLFI